MKININAIKRSLAMLGFDIDDALSQATPLIKTELDRQIRSIPVKDGESRAIVIVPNDNGEYLIVKTRFDKHAAEYMHSEGYTTLEKLVQNLTNNFDNE